MDKDFCGLGTHHSLFVTTSHTVLVFVLVIPISSDNNDTPYKPLSSLVGQLGEHAQNEMLVGRHDEKVHCRVEGCGRQWPSSSFFFVRTHRTVETFEVFLLCNDTHLYIYVIIVIILFAIKIIHVIIRNKNDSAYIN